MNADAKREHVKHKRTYTSSKSNQNAPTQMIKYIQKPCLHRFTSARTATDVKGTSRLKKKVKGMKAVFQLHVFEPALTK